MNVTFEEASHQFLQSTGKLFYIINPEETSYKNAEEVPNYWKEIWLPFFVLLIAEQIILYIKNKKVRWNEQVTSLSHWIFDETVRFFSRGAEYYLYIQLYNKFHLWDLPWNALSTWIIAALSVEFCYYWAHRCNHEITFFWVFHQVHHSSEEFSLAVGLRQSVLQTWCNFIFYVPLTVFIPPSHFITHKQFNLIYQLCLHTTLIDDIKPFDWFFNTAKHHRVHHGCNLYCLDKNYGGVLIIWDRLFGTFQEEQDKIVYGLVVNSRSFNPLYLQAIFQKSATMHSWWNKIGTFWKGPSWYPGAPRLGLDQYKTYVTPRYAYDPYIPTWQVLYVFLHFASVIIYHYRLHLMDFSNSISMYMVLGNVLTLISIGMLFDRDNRIALFEFARCIFSLYITPYDQSVLNTYVYILHCFSLYCIWIPHIVKLTSNYAYEYSIMIQRHSKRVKVHSNLKTKLLYIIKGFLRSEHSECEMNEIPDLKINRFPNNLNGISTLNETSSKMK
ncbi:PREDICTED: alkylglycerol monooxygenase-like isoform X2 [Dinoponera quadriceps]|uniref:Alkylglycerol monooxygenase-like isoform X2 n=1 Tax=Dinoponera quadriceps TaxID=609295 RepID=A0A6P3Y9G5_DINQU|nr:PREDICTED: alkylglycerol monooxygenase-like isoform X2 [Dinoponera quadriceps]